MHLRFLVLSKYWPPVILVVAYSYSFYLNYPILLIGYRIMSLPSWSADEFYHTSMTENLTIKGRLHFNF